MMNMKPRGFLIIAVVLIAAGFITLTVTRDKINLVLISIDTLRPDHLGCYGYDRDTSPNMDSIAREGAIFKTVISQSSWTLPAHATLLTSTYPSVHGVTRDDKALDPKLVTLAELLRENGYMTAAFTGGGYMHKRFGFSQGFEVYMDSYVDARGSYSPFLDVHWSSFRSVLLNWLNANHDEPFFLFIHSYDVHKPYDPPAEYVRRFYPSCRGEIITFLAHDMVVIKGVENPVVKIPVDSLSSGEIDHIVAHYDAEIRLVDEEVGILLEALERYGIKDETMIVITSDHGEQFLEHGGLGHRNTLFEEELRVPLLIRFPPFIKQGTVIEAPVAIVDIMPTLLELMRLRRGDFDGESILPLLKGQHRQPLIISEYQEGGLASIRDGRYKLIVSQADRLLHLYDIIDDPGELADIAANQPYTRDRLFNELRERIVEQRLEGEKYRGAEAGEAGKEYIQQQLKALGYIEE